MGRFSGIFMSHKKISNNNNKKSNNPKYSPSLDLKATLEGITHESPLPRRENIKGDEIQTWLTS